MYFVINKCVTAVKVSNFSGHYLRNRSTLDIGVLGYIGIVQHKEHSPQNFVHSSWDTLYVSGRAGSRSNAFDLYLGGAVVES